MRTSIDNLDDTSLQLPTTGVPLTYVTPLVDTDEMQNSPFSLTPLGSSSPVSSFINLTSLTTSAFPSTQPSPTISTAALLPAVNPEYHRPMEKIPTFLGTGDDEVTLKDFMKVYRHAAVNNSNLNMDPAKIENFQNYLGSDSPVEEWYEDEGKMLTKWTDFKLVFFTKFPMMDKAKKMAVELERELVGLRLQVEDLGQKEKYGGQEVWSHVAFTEKAINLAW